MRKITQREQVILALLLQKKGARSSSTLHAEAQQKGLDLSLVTIKRTLSAMAKSGLLEVAGSGPSTAYALATLGRLHADVDAGVYCAIDPDKRYGFDRYNFDLLPGIPEEVFFEKETQTLQTATAEYKKRTTDVSPTIQKKELERFVIELSWKSSKIEGNTYTLLDTEKLLLEGKKAAGHSKEEATMILNHKEVFAFIHQRPAQFKTMTRRNVEALHAILMKGLGVGSGLRQKPVGILGSRYRPLDNIHQVHEAMQALFATVNRMSTPYGKALLALLGISYIQPFEDGNKRTSRLMANALLMAHGCAPLSYRSVDEQEYREAILVFYELNSLVPFKDIFISQYDFAARNYVAK